VDRTSEALEAINEGEALAERLSSVWCFPDCTGIAVCFSRLLVLRRPKLRLRFCEAIRIAREQKSILLEKCAEGTYAEYRRQKVSASEGRGFRLPLL